MHISIHYINLDHSTGRRDYMENMFDGLGLRATRLSAIKGSALSEEECRHYNPIQYNTSRRSAQEVGCYLSHRAIWKKIAEGDAAFGAVFEDDIKLLPEAVGLLSDTSWIPDDVAFIKLDSCIIEVEQGAFRDLESTSRRLRRMHSLLHGLAGYIVSKKFAATLLERTKIMRAPIDDQVFDPEYGVFRGTKVWQLYPAICYQELFDQENPFLPATAELSSMQESREHNRYHRPKMPFGWQKILREIYRPYRHAKIRFNQFVNRTVYRTVCETVPFKE
ncbi:glycosyltransferase family 25 protein [Loktanella sp. S4079]|uniref:glycosyltransferase family 25 protein n=1 Tax=Loktanella sp. S4079 TaxID=579483 RepID=UPI00069606A7|nr:glycosyltransferase family 25 protein [Loktanella sp. S4079]